MSTSKTKYTNINILDDTKRFKYIIEYKDDVEFVPKADLHYSIDVLDDPLRIDFFDSEHQFTRNDNIWSYYIRQEVDKDNLTDYIPSSYNISSVNIYFPQNSVESYTDNGLYALTVNTWIHGHIVYLGTYLINRYDALACDQEKKFINTNYYECVNVKFIDPWYLTYSDDWKDFRQKVCGEKEIEGREINNTGSVLNFTLYPVVLNNEEYIKLDPYIGGQNAINISDNVSDYVGCGIELLDDDISGKVVHSYITFNQSYQEGSTQSFNDFKQYMEETYDIDTDNLHLTYNLLVVDDDNIYKVVSIPKDDIMYDFTRDEIFFEGWGGWKEGLRLILNIDVYSQEQDDEDTRDDIMLLRSNTISITQDVMKYFVVDQDMSSLPKMINLDLINMNNYTINAVNKIEKKIIQVDKLSDNKANIVRPVYYQVHSIRDLVIHPAVTENVCINLDAYKSTVDTFYIQVEGVTFVESARVSAGVIFKIVGSNLAGETSTGTYYLLNQDKELITTGKYTYEL